MIYRIAPIGCQDVAALQVDRRQSLSHLLKDIGRGHAGAHQSQISMTALLQQDQLLPVLDLVQGITLFPLKTLTSELADGRQQSSDQVRISQRRACTALENDQSAIIVN